MPLRGGFVATQADLRSHPEHALASFLADSNLIQGLRCETQIRQFSLTVDEPASGGGTDAGPNPVELVLAALASCQEITYRLYAEALGIPLEAVSVKIEGDLDLRGLYAVKDGVRPGFKSIRGTVRLKSSASSAELVRFKQNVDAHCPVLDILRSGVPFTLDLAPAPPPA